MIPENDPCAMYPCAYMMSLEPSSHNCPRSMPCAFVFNVVSRSSISVKRHMTGHAQTDHKHSVNTKMLSRADCGKQACVLCVIERIQVNMIVLCCFQSAQKPRCFGKEVTWEFSNTMLFNSFTQRRNYDFAADGIVKVISWLWMIWFWIWSQRVLLYITLVDITKTPILVPYL